MTEVNEWVSAAQVWSRGTKWAQAWKQKAGARKATKGRRIHVVGDSHGRQCFGRIKSVVEREVKLDVFPGKPLSYLIDQAGDPRKIVGGTNNVLDESIAELRENIHSLSERLKGDVLWVETPLSFDDGSKSVLLKKQNKKIKEECIKNKWVYFSSNAVLDMNCYTRHGLHLYPLGKDVLCGLITS